MIRTNVENIGDPFIVCADNCYYMYGTTSLKSGTIDAGVSFAVYKTYDLENFYEPKIIIDAKKIGFWADRDFWAPEVHEYKGKYYLFGSLKTLKKKQI